MNGPRRASGTSIRGGRFARHPQLRETGPSSSLQQSPHFARIDYTHGSPNRLRTRPYLVLELAGPSGRAERIHGLIDTGADSSVLPIELAALLGYHGDTLESPTLTQLVGSVEVARATIPISARLPHAPSDEFEITPLFVKECESVLRGRLDLMKRFDVFFAERERYFLIGPFTDQQSATRSRDAGEPSRAEASSPEPENRPRDHQTASTRH